ncbi:MAG: AsmA family protein, partial [Chitinivibrionales bacterium]|nr:AsmA family protein [Chitinivibrionales bacterium]
MAKQSPAKVVGIILAVVVGLLIIAGVTLKIMFPPAKLKAMTMPHIEKALGRDVELERISLAVFPYLGVKMHGLEIANTGREGFSKGPFVKLDAFILKVKVMPLFQRRLEISEILLNGPEILVETDKKGSFNFDDLAIMAQDTTKTEKSEEEKAPAAPALPVPLALEKFAIEEGTVIYHDRKGGMKLGLGEINERVDFSIDKELKDIKTTGELVVNKISFYSKDVPKPFAGLVLTFNHDLDINLVDGICTINEMKASLQKIYIALTGKVTDFNQTPKLDLALKTEKLDIADILAEIPVEMAPEIAKTDGSGSLQIDIAVSGALDSAGPDINGTLALNNGIVNYTDLPQKITDMNADIAFTTNSLNISTFGLKMGKNPVNLTAKVDNFASPVVDAALNAKVKLDDIKNIIEIPEGNDISGLIDADITAQGEVDPNDPAKIKVDGSVKLDNVRVVTPAVTKPVVCNGSVDLSNTRIAEKITIGIGKSSMKLTADLVDYLSLVLPDSTKNYPRPRLKFAVTSPYLNTNEFLPKPPEGAPAKKAGAESTPPQEPGLLLAAPLPGIDMQGTISNNHVIYESMELHKVSANYKCINDIIDLSLRARLFDGTFSHNLDANAQNIEDLKIKSAMDISNIQISQLIATFKGYLEGDNKLFAELRKLDESLSGKINLNTDLVTSGGTSQELTDNLNGSVLARLNDGKIEKGAILEGITRVVDKFYAMGPVEFQDMKVEATIDNGKVFLKDLDMASSFGDWYAEGTIGFDASLDIALSNRLTKRHSKPVAKMEGEARGAAKKGLQAAAGAAGLSQYVDAGSVVDGFGSYLDKDGRATLELGIKGTVAKPSFTAPKLVRFSGGKKQDKKPQELIADKMKEELEKKKKEAEELARKQIEEQKRKAQELAAKKKAEAAKKAKEEAKKAEKKVEEKAKDAAG